MTSKYTKFSKMMPRSRVVAGFLKDDWSEFVEVCNRRWSHFGPPLVEGKFSRSKILGSGYFGVVMKTADPKLVIKVTSDSDEGYYNQIVLEDPALRYSPGLPLILDAFHVPQWNAHVILRENVRFGVDRLPESSPLMRSISVLDSFGEAAMRIEGRVAQALKAIQSLSAEKDLQRSEFTYAFREAQGLTRSEIVKALKKLPKVSKRSKYYHAMDVIRHSLDKYGIALWDLHEMNLGRHKYDMTEFDPKAPRLDRECILILDVGGNFGSPIMAQEIDTINIS